MHFNILLKHECRDMGLLFPQFHNNCLGSSSTWLMHETGDGEEEILQGYLINISKFDCQADANTRASQTNSVWLTLYLVCTYNCRFISSCFITPFYPPHSMCWKVGLFSEHHDGCLRRPAIVMVFVRTIKCESLTTLPLVHCSLLGYNQCFKSCGITVPIFPWNRTCYRPFLS